jgi:hypothetical protein
MEPNHSQPDPPSLSQAMIWIDELRQEHKDRPKRWVKRLLIMSLIGAGLMAFTDLLALALGWKWLLHHPAIVISFTGLPMVAYTMCPSSRELEAARGLASYRPEGKDAVLIAPALLEAMATIHAGTQSTVMEALVRVLPSVEHRDAHLFEKNHRDKLREVVKNCCRKAYSGSWSQEYVIAVLKTVGVLKDTSFCHIVERLASMTDEDEKRRAIRAAAIECHERLQVVLLEQEQQKYLLRPVDESDAGQLLLRGVAEQTLDSGNLVMPATNPVSNMPYEHENSLESRN